LIDQLITAQSPQLFQQGLYSYTKALNQANAPDFSYDSSECMVHNQAMEHSGVEVGLAEKHIIIW
jgi:hypothetical protein